MLSDQIFISYSKKDSNFANRLADDLAKVGFVIWMDRSIVGGDKWRESIEGNLKESKEVIIIVSPNSMASDWVRHEGSLAYGWGKKLFPILLEPVVSLPPWLEEYQWVNFANVAYEVAFQALVNDLTPSNPVQNLLDERMEVYQQTGELFGEETIRLIESARDTIQIAPEVDEVLQKSKQSIEEQKQHQIQQQAALSEARKKQQVIRKKGKITVGLLLTGFFVIILVSILSFLPQPTGWQRLSSFERFTERNEGNHRDLLALDDKNPEAIYISDSTPGGFFRSAFNQEKCWEKIEVLPDFDLQVTNIAVSDGYVYIIASNKLFSSNDGGKSWKPLSLPTDQAYLQPTTIAVNPVSPQELYVGSIPAELFVYEGKSKYWQPVDLPVKDNSVIKALDHNGTNLILAMGEIIWTRSSASPKWIPVLRGVNPIYGLSMVGNEGRFFIAGGDQGILDADISSDQWYALADSPPTRFIQSVAATNDSRYAADQEGVWFWRLLRWTDPNWFRVQLHQPIPCYE